MRLHDADVPVKVVKVPTAPTAITSREEKPRKTAHFQAVDPRAVLDVAVGNHHLTVDHPQQYQSLENPANRYISGTAGDAGGILRRLLVLQ
jgi:hypothetical protein